MLRTMSDQNRLHLTADLRAVEGLALKKAPRLPGPAFAPEIKRFPPVEDVVAVLDRIAKRAFIA